jgi:hypothetical protein
LIIPNVLFPDTVRMAHLIEKTSSRNISLWPKKNRSCKDENNTQNTC